MNKYHVDAIAGLFDSDRLGHMSAIAEWPADRTTCSRTPYFTLLIQVPEGYPGANFDDMFKLLYEQMILFSKATPKPATLYWRTGDRITIDLFTCFEQNIKMYQLRTRIAIPGCKADTVPLLEGVLKL
jgi:hypothetical protein